MRLSASQEIGFEENETCGNQGMQNNVAENSNVYYYILRQY